VYESFCASGSYSRQVTGSTVFSTDETLELLEQHWLRDRYSRVGSVRVALEGAGAYHGERVGNNRGILRRGGKIQGSGDGAGIGAAHCGGDRLGSILKDQDALVHTGGRRGQRIGPGTLALPDAENPPPFMMYLPVWSVIVPDPVIEIPPQ
jgi:hypothetical protein